MTVIVSSSRGPCAARKSEAGRLEGCGRWVRGNVGASALRDGPAGLLRV